MGLDWATIFAPARTASIDLAFDGFELLLRGHRAHVDVVLVVGSVAHRARLFREQVDEGVVDGFVHVDPFDAAAALARVLITRPGGSVGGALEIRVLEHDHRILAAELERERRERLGRRSHQLLAGRRRSP